MDEDRIFKALADRTRRDLLDRLLQHDGRTLTQLRSGQDMTRFGIMKHLKILEEAGLVDTQRSGREKLHFLNAEPLRSINERIVSYIRRTPRRAG
jgi:DNA-binding transcriptional ArsR family regulator